MDHDLPSQLERQHGLLFLCGVGDPRSGKYIEPGTTLGGFVLQASGDSSVGDVPSFFTSKELEYAVATKNLSPADYPRGTLWVPCFGSDIYGTCDGSKVVGGGIGGKDVVQVSVIGATPEPANAVLVALVLIGFAVHPTLVRAFRPLR